MVFSTILSENFEVILTRFQPFFCYVPANTPAMRRMFSYVLLQLQLSDEFTASLSGRAKSGILIMGFHTAAEDVSHIRRRQSCRLREVVDVVAATAAAAPAQINSQINNAQSSAFLQL